MKTSEELAQEILNEIKDGLITGPVLNKRSVVSQLLSVWETQIRTDQLRKDKEMVFQLLNGKI